MIQASLDAGFFVLQNDPKHAGRLHYTQRVEINTLTSDMGFRGDRRSMLENLTSEVVS
jgi:hypothetical protein